MTDTTNTVTGTIAEWLAREGLDPGAARPVRSVMELTVTIARKHPDWPADAIAASMADLIAGTIAAPKNRPNNTTN